MIRSESLSDLLDVIEKFVQGKKGQCECGIDLNTNFHRCTCHNNHWIIKQMDLRLIKQKEAVDKIQAIMENNEILPPEQQKKAILVQAPTGYGKSWISIALAMKYGASILTATVDLQEQYRNDFPFMPNVKGKSWYDCLQHHNEKSCASGYCKGCRYNMSYDVRIDQEREQEREITPTLEEKFIHISADNYNNEQNIEGTGIECSYYNALKKGALASSAIYNYHSFLVPVSKQIETRSRLREVLICDEAHAYDDNVADVFTTTLDNELTIELLDEIDPTTKQERPGQLLVFGRDDDESRISIDVEGRLIFDQALDDEGKIRYAMNFVQLLLRRFEIKQSVYDRCKEHTLDLLYEGHVKKHSELRCEKGHDFALVEKNRKKITKGCRTSPKARIRGCTELRNYIKEDKFLECKDPSHHICRDDGEPWECNEDHTKYNHEMHTRLKNYALDLEHLIENLSRASNEGNITDWGVISTEDPEIRIGPMNTRHVTQELLRSHSSTVFLSSTIEKEMFLSRTGIRDDYIEYIQLGNLIPVSHRPIKLLKNALNLGKENLRKEEIWVKIMARIGEILEKHEGERGIILLTQYEQLNQIFDRADDYLRKRLTFDLQKSDFEKTREEHLAKKDSVIVTAKAQQGIDLSYHQSRFQIILKAPWTEKVHKWQNARWDRMREKDPDTFWKESAFRFVQFCGRSVRHIDDAAVTYVLDKSAVYMVQNFPSWFKDAVELDADIMFSSAPWFKKIDPSMPDGNDCVWRMNDYWEKIHSDSGGDDDSEIKILKPEELRELEERRARKSIRDQYPDLCEYCGSSEHYGPDCPKNVGDYADYRGEPKDD